MPRQVYLVIHKSQKAFGGISRAHWSVFVPEAGSNTVGKFIHVIGNPFIGFRLEFRRNHDVALAVDIDRLIPLATVDEQYIQDTPGFEKDSIDMIPQDTLEDEAKKIGPPRASPEPLNPAVRKDCQDWTRAYVTALVGLGVFPDTALQVLQEAEALDKASSTEASTST